MVQIILTIIAFILTSCGASTDVSLLGSLSENNQSIETSNDEKDSSESDSASIDSEDNERDSSIDELIEIRDLHDNRAQQKIKSTE